MSAADEYLLVPKPPELADYLRLRSESGLAPKNEAQARGALSGSWSFCHIRSSDGEIAAMGRVIADGGWYFRVADLATLPTHQRRGLGRRVLDWLISDIERRAPKGAYVTLVADLPGERLYEQVGFLDVAPRQRGMEMMLSE